MCTTVQVCVPPAPPRWCCIFQWCWIQLFLTACYISSVYQHVFWIWSVFLKIPDRICQHTEYIKYLVSTRQLHSSLLKEGFPISVKKKGRVPMSSPSIKSACSLWLCLAFWKSKKHSMQLDFCQEWKIYLGSNWIYYLQFYLESTEDHPVDLKMSNLS